MGPEWDIPMSSQAKEPRLRELLYARNQGGPIRKGLV
jgi:hypothetical protein